MLYEGDRAVVLSESVASRLDVVPGDRLFLTVERERNGAKDSASTEVMLKAVVSTGRRSRRSVTPTVNCSTGLSSTSAASASRSSAGRPSKSRSATATQPTSYSAKR